MFRVGSEEIEVRFVVSTTGKVSVRWYRLGNPVFIGSPSSRMIWRCKVNIYTEGSGNVLMSAFPLSVVAVCSNVRIGFNFSITALVNIFASFPSSSVPDCNPLSTLSLQAGIALLWTWWTLASLSFFVHICSALYCPLRLSQFRFNSRLITDLSLQITFAIWLFLKPCCFITKIVYLCSLVRWLIFCSIW